MPGQHWTNLGSIQAHSFTCGYCGKFVGTDKGWVDIESQGAFRIYICPFCGRATYFENDRLTPGAPFGEHVANLPVDIADLYEQARACMGIPAYTASVLICRKLLMNIAVSKGAKENAGFITYVEYLADKNYIPPDAKDWVNHIRQKGNEATHDINLMSRDDAEELISFTEMLLKVVFEFPARIKKTNP